MRWIARQREHWRSAVAQALTERAGALDGADQWGDALALVGRAIEIAPWLEAAWRRRAQLYYLRGDRAAALNALARLEAHLRDAHAAPPSAETLDLKRTIERADARPAQRRPALPASLLRHRC